MFIIIRKLCLRTLIVANRNVLLPESQKMRIIYKLIWILQNITYATAPQVTIVYWDINYDGKNVKNDVLELGGNMPDNWRVEVKARHRIQSGEIKVLDSCVVPASTYGLDTVALSNTNNVDERGRTG